MSEEQKEHSTHKVLKIIIAILVITALIFVIIRVISCVRDDNSNIITKDGIQYSKITMTTNGINVDAYSVVGCDSDITILNIPNKINDLPVLHINKEAFLNNKNLREITLPNSITKISLQTAPFKGCDNIEKVTMASSDLMLLFADYGSGDNILNHAVPSSLHYVYISEGCTKINYKDFYNCSNIREIHIPYSVKEIIDGTKLHTVNVNGNTNDYNKFNNLPFKGCTSLRIFCAASSKPSGWETYWNYIDANNQAEVIWGTY